MGLLFFIIGMNVSAGHRLHGRGYSGFDKRSSLGRLVGSPFTLLVDRPVGRLRVVRSDRYNNDIYDLQRK